MTTLFFLFLVCTSLSSSHLNYQMQASSTLPPMFKMDHLSKVIHAYNCTQHESTGYSPHFLLFGCHPHLPVDLLFGLTEPADPVSHKGYAEKWRKRMIEAYKVANKHHQAPRGSPITIRRQRGVILQPGDKVWVRNVGERGGPGKLRSYWENRIYVVKEQVVDNPVYVIHPEGNRQGGTRTLHRYLLLLVKDLPVECPQQPATPTLISKQQHEKARVRVQKSGDQEEDAETSASAEDSGGGYWLRKPRARSELGITAALEERATSPDGRKAAGQRQVPSQEGHDEPKRGMRSAGEEVHEGGSVRAKERDNTGD